VNDRWKQVIFTHAGQIQDIQYVSRTSGNERGNEKQVIEKKDISESEGIER